MAIIPVTMYTIVCDNCGKHWCDTDDEHSAYVDSSQMLEVANESGWYEDKNKHYCSDCWSWDNNDQLTLKKIIK